MRIRVWPENRPQVSRRSVACAVVMVLVFASLLVLVYLTATRARQHDADASKAEPVRRGPPSTQSPFGCPKGQFPCPRSWRCLPLDKRCDGTVDCPNAEDELECVCAFRMPLARFCDKYPDCFDESDENFCSYCPENSFNCGDGKCIPRDRVCDSSVDCDNFMDENFCFRLSSDGVFATADDAAVRGSAKSGYLLRNMNGVWFPVCANPHDVMQDALASFACVSITANPLAESTHRYRRFRVRSPGDFVYHYQGRFVRWDGCLTDSGLFVRCDDVRCGFNPKHLLPRRPKGRIVGGERSEPGAWPWHGAVYRNGSYACGATLIDTRWLISAAHCFLNARAHFYEVQLGMLRRRSFTPHQRTYAVDRVVLHPKFNVVTLDFDIALLRTSQPVRFDFWVRPICLPGRGEVRPGAFCTAIGWGDTGEMKPDSEELQEVHVPLMHSCRNSDRWLCAGYPEGGRDACQGDSGGPLMCLREDGLSWYVAGVISAGTGCARPRTPGMYTRVSHFLDWIRSTTTTEEGMETPLLDCPGWVCAAVGGGRCLDPAKVCDGRVDCYDAQDEAHCYARR